MNNEFDGMSFSGNETGMTIPNNVPIKMSNSTFEGNKVGLMIRDPISVNERLGLPLDTPKEVLLKAIELLKSAHLDGADEKAALNDSPLWPYLQRAADASTVATALISMVGNGAVAGIIASLAMQ